MREEIYEAALNMLAKSGLPKDVQQDLYRHYIKDVEEHSESFAWETMHYAIQDEKAEDLERAEECKADRLDNINEDDWREER